MSLDYMPCNIWSMVLGSWDDVYKRAGRLWGEEPSVLALAAMEYLQKHRPGSEALGILDIGCGYGRDTLYFFSNLECRILGIDAAPEAVRIASSSVPEAWRRDIDFQCCSFTELKEQKYDVVFASNLYQVLQAADRRELARVVMGMLKPGGLLFLCTLSVSDPEHYGKGIPVPGDPHSFHERMYLHFATREELAGVFAFLNVKELYGQEYYEKHTADVIHHHISWMLIGELPAASDSEA